MAGVSIQRQIATLAGEQPYIDRRLSDAVARRAMRPAEAEWLREAIEAAITTLEWVRDNEATIRRVHAAVQAGEEQA